MRIVITTLLITWLAFPVLAAEPAASKEAAAPAGQLLKKDPASSAAPAAKGAEGPKADAAVAKEAEAEQQKILYAVGLSLARQLSIFNLSGAELDLVKQGFSDGITGKTPLSTVESYSRKIQEMATSRRNAEGEKLLAKSKEYLTTASFEEGAFKTDTGLVFLQLREGTGPSPNPNDRVVVQYSGTLIDGREFDSSYKRGQPAEFALSSVIKCWSQGVPLMKTGGKARLICPPALAYGEHGAGIIPAKATLIFDLELLEVKPEKL